MITRLLRVLTMTAMIPMILITITIVRMMTTELPMASLEKMRLTKMSLVVTRPSMMSLAEASLAISP